MATMLFLPSTLAHNRRTSHASRLPAKPFAFQHVQKHSALPLLGCVVLAIGLYLHVQKHSALPLLGCVVLAIGLYLALPWLFPAQLSGQLLGRWQLQTQIRNGSRVGISGEYEFRSDYTTSKITGISGSRAGLWIIRAPIDPAAHSSSLVLPSTTIVTTTYRFIDTLTHHISVQIYDQQGTPDANLWPGPGIYDITMIDDNQLTLRVPDSEAGGWIVLECTKVP